MAIRSAIECICKTTSPDSSEAGVQGEKTEPGGPEVQLARVKKAVSE